MADLTLRLERPMAERSDDKQRIEELHAQRARLTHALVEVFGLEVRDWGDTDAPYPREVTEIVVALTPLAPILIPALVDVMRMWIEQRNMRDIKIIDRDGNEISIAYASREDVIAVLETVRRSRRRRAKR